MVESSDIFQSPIFLSAQASDGTGSGQARPSPRPDDYVRPPTLLSVAAADEEDVEWIWTHYADGHSAVTGYRIVSRLPTSLTTR